VPETARLYLVVGEVQEVPAQVFLAQAVRAGMVMLGRLADGGNIPLLRSCGEPPQMHVLEHPSA
jgi:hypothetical protein